MLTISEDESERFLSIVRYHMESDFEPVSDYSISYMGYPLVGYPIHRNAVPKLLPKAIDFDFDRTLTSEDSPNGFIAYLDHLSYLNNDVDKRYFDIVKIVGEFSPGNVNEPAEKISKIFRSCGLTLHQHKESCIEGAKDIKMVKGYLSAFNDLENMLYAAGVKSGSPEGLVKLVALNNIGFEASVLDKYVKGSSYEFRKDRFVRMFALLYENKRAESEIFLKDVTGVQNGLHIAVGDQIGDAYMVKSVINPFIYIGSSTTQKIPADFTINLPEVRKNLKNIIKPLKKYERALAFFFGYDEREQQKIIKLSLEIKKSFSEILEGVAVKPNIGKSRDELLENVNLYLDSVDALISRVFTKIDRNIKILEQAEDERVLVKSSRELWKKLETYCPEI